VRAEQFPDEVEAARPSKPVEIILERSLVDIPT
jgi:hypothetical protein